MPSVKKDVKISEYQDFVKEVYGLNNDRYFSVEDMLTHIQRFIMRGLKGIRKNNVEKVNINLIVAHSFFTSLLNRLHINIEEEIWKRFPYVCSYCGSCPCSCAETHPGSRKKIEADEDKRPETLNDFQIMFNEIYPAKKRNLEHAGVHLAEELGEFSEVILKYRGQHDNSDFEKIKLEAADLYSCFLGVFNSIEINIAEELSSMFSENCHVCRKSPCQCSFLEIMGFKS